jgi:hypothetical protein
VLAHRHHAGDPGQADHDACEGRRVRRWYRATAEYSVLQRPAGLCRNLIGQSALLAGFTIEEIETLELHASTVQGFQGSEAGTVIVSLGLVDDDYPARCRFVGNPRLSNVMVTPASRAPDCAHFANRPGRHPRRLPRTRRRV